MHRQNRRRTTSNLIGVFATANASGDIFSSCLTTTHHEFISKVCQTMTKRIFAVDSARAVAALAVFFHHYHQQFLGPYEPKSLSPLLDCLGSWGVCVFFVLSGFCIHWGSIQSSRAQHGFNLKEYSIKRFLRIYPMFTLTVLACDLIGLKSSSNLISANANVGDVLSHLALLSSFQLSHHDKINSVLWSVIVECHFYILYGLFYKYFVGRRIFRITMVAIVIGGLTFIASISIFPRGESRTLIQHCFAATWWTWCLGACVAHFLKSINPANLPSPPLRRLALAATIFASLAIGYLPGSAALQAERFVLPPLCAAGLLLLLTASTSPMQILSRIGDFSYSLYLIHPIALLIALRYLGGNPMSSILAFPIALVFAAITYQLIEKPFITLGKTLSARVNNSEAAKKFHAKTS